MRLIGWIIIFWLAGCLFLFAWLMDTPTALTMARGAIGGWVGPTVLIEPRMQTFGLYVACPLVILAAWLIDRGD
jgi:hypothetical protein